ncbi:hypothetical protein ABZ438_08070 [Streptomyces sp. NPDC005786]|uniref:hypothetical protein n=1 Tax=Streptomyces sp. NPDC005786 TaxID=3154891 RepID=UPI0033FE321C
MDATGMLHLLNAEPTLLPPVQGDANGDGIEARRAEGHNCLRCGKPADTALIADLGPHDKRWLDLCFGCFNTVRLADQ